MELSNDLETAMVADIASIKSVDVIYKDGKLVSGFVKNVQLGDSTEITICQHKVLRGENPLHYLNVEKASKITLVFNDGKTKVFE